jgi:hypothetical protein
MLIGMRQCPGLRNQEENRNYGTDRLGRSLESHMPNRRGPGQSDFRNILRLYLI